MDTIVALATARGRAGVAVVRVSGEKAWTVCEALVGEVPAPRRAVLRPIRNLDGELLDHGLVLTFPEGGSFTGEDVCEFQVHGSIAVVSALISACLGIEGVRAARPGEFTQRSFFAGNMDLTEVEALADLIDSETESQRRQAMTILDGTVGRLIESWREDLLSALALLEASLDFADEEIPDGLEEHILAPLERVRSQLEKQLRGQSAAEAVRDGFEVAITGRVNVGKSSLLNALAGRDAAITSSIEGTTRDVIEVHMDIRGISVTLVDTAGLRKTTDEIEVLGIRKGLDRAKSADVVVYLKSSPDENLPDEIEADIVLLSKADVWNLPGLSVVTGEGIQALIDRIYDILSMRVKESSVFARARHFDQLKRARQQIETAVSLLQRGNSSWELVSEELRLAVRALDGIVGRIDVEEVLGRIFSSFCIGK